MDRVIVGNIPSTNRRDFGYRSINTSASHNDNQKMILNDILDLYNKTNEIERVVRENEDFIKLENTHLESVNNEILGKYKNLIEKYNELAKGETIRKIGILPSECLIDDPLFGAVINKTTSDITVRPSRKISKLAVFDSVTDSMYLPNTLDVDIRSQTLGVISETDNDIYAPFYNNNQLYWTRKVVTDNTTEEVVTEYIISLAEEIMTTAEMNEITIHPFLCNVKNVYVRYGDSNPWEEVTGAKYHPAITGEGIDELTNSSRPFTLSFPNIKANQIKIVLKASKYVEGETNLRNFMFGLKHIGAYINYYNTYDASHFNSKVEFNEFDTVVIEGITVNFNNEQANSRYVSDIDYEFYYKDNNGMYQKIFETFPFIPPTNKLMVKFRIGEKYKEMNIRSLVLNYKVIREDYHLMVSYMQNMNVDFKQPFNMYYTVKASDSHEMIEVVGHELTLDNGATWIQMDSTFNGERYIYEHPAFNEVKVIDDCMIRVYDFEGRCGISNKFRISADVLDKPPIIDDIDDIGIKVGEPFVIEYNAADDYAITKHEFSDSNGERWETIVPTIEEDDVRGVKFKRYLLDKTYDEVTNRKCYIRVSDGINEPVVSNMFEIYVNPIEVDSIILDSYELTIPRGKQEKLTHTVVPLNASDQVVHWTSDNESVATVDEFGLITAVNKRYCEITVLSNDKKRKAVCKVTVVIPVEEVKLNASEIDMFVGEEFQLIESILPIDADNKRVTWTASNDKVKVDKYGKVTALKAGACVVTVTTEDGNFISQCTFNVLVPVEGIEINKESITKRVGETEQLVARVIPNNAFDQVIHWKSDNPKIASVSEYGVVTANAPGITSITATTNHKGFQKVCDVEVLVPVNGVTLNKNKTTRWLDEGPEQLFATVLPGDAYDKGVTWRSDNKLVATVDEKGNVTPLMAGIANITVITDDGKFTDTCAYTVKGRITDIEQNKPWENHIYSSEKTGEITLSWTLKGWSSDTEVEPLTIETDEEGVIELIKQPNQEWNTKEAVISVNINLLGEVGKRTVTIKTLDERIVKTVLITVTKPVESINFLNFDSESEDSSGAKNIFYNCIGGYKRVLHYEIKPEDSELGVAGVGMKYDPNLFSFANWNDSVVDKELSVSIKIDNKNFSGNESGEKILESSATPSWENREKCPNVVAIFKTGYAIDFNWSEKYPKITKMKTGESYPVPIKTNFTIEIDDPNDYEFADKAIFEFESPVGVSAMSGVSKVDVIDRNHIVVWVACSDLHQNDVTFKVGTKYAESYLTFTADVSNE